MDDEPGRPTGPVGAAALRQRLADLDARIAGAGDRDAVVEQAKVAARQADVELTAARRVHEAQSDDVRRLGSVGGRLKAAFGGGAERDRAREEVEEHAARAALDEAQRRSDLAWAALDAARAGAPVLPQLREQRAAVLSALEAHLLADGSGPGELHDVVVGLREATTHAEALAEAIGAASDAAAALDRAGLALDEAHILATTTMAREGTLTSDVVKYAEIDAAQDHLREASLATGELVRILADDRLAAPSLPVADLDTAFDLLGGVVSRIRVRDAVVTAQRATRRLLPEVQRTLADLESAYATTRQEIDGLTARREQLLIG